MRPVEERSIPIGYCSWQGVADSALELTDLAKLTLSRNESRETFALTQKSARDNIDLVKSP